MNRPWQGVLLIFALVNVAAVSAQGPGLHRVMRKKMATSQKMLQAVVTSDWASLEAQSRDLQALTTDPGWMVMKAPEYARHSAVFTEAARALHDAAARRDLEATPPAYISLTMSCVQCHRYLARNRLARK